METIKKNFLKENFQVLRDTKCNLVYIDESSDDKVNYYIEFSKWRKEVFIYCVDKDIDWVVITNFMKRKSYIINYNLAKLICKQLELFVELDKIKELAITC